jgi:hypothetical protein
MFCHVAAVKVKAGGRYDSCRVLDGRRFCQPHKNTSLEALRGKKLRLWGE